jgi:ubiquinone/menaquinone biosynthesis C-methylase UbiE
MKNLRICPWWMGYALLLPFRKWQHNPYSILEPYVRKGMSVMDFGCAMGYFSLPLAKMTGDTGNVFCVDIQQKMLEKLQQRAQNASLDHIIKPLLVNSTYEPGKLQNQLDFSLLFFVVHEVPDPGKLFSDLFGMTKTGGKVLFAEPSGHVSAEQFEQSLQKAKDAGFIVAHDKPLPKGLAAVLIKPA